MAFAENSLTQTFVKEIVGILKVSVGVLKLLSTTSLNSENLIARWVPRQLSVEQHKRL